MSLLEELYVTAPSPTATLAVCQTIPVFTFPSTDPDAVNPETSTIEFDFVNKDYGMPRQTSGTNYLPNPHSFTDGEDGTGGIVTVTLSGTGDPNRQLCRTH